MFDNARQAAIAAGFAAFFAVVAIAAHLLLRRRDRVGSSGRRSDEPPPYGDVTRAWQQLCAVIKRQPRGRQSYLIIPGFIEGTVTVVYTVRSVAGWYVVTQWNGHSDRLLRVVCSTSRPAQVVCKWETRLNGGHALRPVEGQASSHEHDGMQVMTREQIEDLTKDLVGASRP